jgi:hypothetical protein
LIGLFLVLVIPLILFTISVRRRPEGMASATDEKEIP